MLTLKYYYIDNPDGTFYKGQFLSDDMVEEYVARGYTVRFYGKYMD